MNKNDLIIKVSQAVGKSKKEVSEIVEAFLNQIAEGLSKGEKVTLTNFGTFEKNVIKNLDIYSPYDGRLLKNTQHTRVHFKSSLQLKTRLAEKKFTE